MKRLISLTILLSLLTVGRVFSQQLVIVDREPLKGTGVNLSLWKKAATQNIEDNRSTCFNLGLISWMNQLDGIGINLLTSVTKQHVNGLQAAGIANMVTGNVNGLQIAGITNFNAGITSGISLSGLANLTTNGSNGLLASGLANITGGKTRGVVVSGLFNMTGESTLGVQLCGLTNIAGDDFKGVAAAGLLNMTGNNHAGVQIAGILNIAGNKMKGVQLAPANVAVHAKGLQIGLVNYYAETMEGFQLGLVNANKHTRVQLLAYGGNSTKFNIGARFKNELFYTILGCGTHYLDFGNKFSGAVFYRAGLELPLYKQLYVSGDLGYQHIETFKNKDQGIPARLYGLQARLNLEYRINEQLGVFLTGGYGGSRYYDKNQTYDKGLLVEGGIVIFKY